MPAKFAGYILARLDLNQRALFKKLCTDTAGLDLICSMEFDYRYKQEGLEILEEGVEIPENVPKFNFDDYKYVEFLGRGGVRFSYKVVNVNMNVNDFFTLKRILVLSEEIDDQRHKAQIMHDMVLATSVNHPNIMTCLGVCKNDYGIYFLYDFMPRNLGDITIQDEEKLARIAYQVLQGLVYLRREKGIVFKHLTPNNILCDSSGSVVKIGDVGIVKDKYITLDRVVIALDYMKYIAPENFHPDSDIDDLQSERYGKSDAWSLGVSLLHCYYGRYPFDKRVGNLRRYLLAGINLSFDYGELKGCDLWPPRPPSDASPLFRDFISSCLELDVSKRAGVDELVSHGFITSNCSVHGLDNAHD